MSKTAENYLPEVRKQYEEFPYPERNPEDEKKYLCVKDEARLELVNHFCFKGKQDFNNFRVLIAGGGTGDAAILWAEQLREKENCEVVYLDMSTASMKIAQDRAKVRKLNNIKWIHDSLLSVPHMDLGTFDMIDCSGVLHHLKDPDAGLKALKSVLKPTGAMHIMVYAPYGRTAIYMIQELMRMINGNEENPREKIENTKIILKSLPEYHWFELSKKSRIWVYNDTENDAGLYDLFLHSQDRAYTILEVHDWLERCGLKITTEPGSINDQRYYLPESFIKDDKILAIIKSYPLKIQQAIGESLSGKIAKHAFFVFHDDAEKTEAQLTNKDLIVCKGTMPYADFEELGAVALEQRRDFTVTFGEVPGTPFVCIPDGKYIPSLLRQIDGKRTVAEILEAVKNSPKYKDTKIDEDLLFQEFETLFTSLKRGHVAFLRDKSVEPFTSIYEMQKRVTDMYK